MKSINEITDTIGVTVYSVGHIPINGMCNVNIKEEEVFVEVLREDFYTITVRSPIGDGFLDIKK